jgi:hypothetical protein
MFIRRFSGLRTPPPKALNRTRLPDGMPDCPPCRGRRQVRQSRSSLRARRPAEREKVAMQAPGPSGDCLASTRTAAPARLRLHAAGWRGRFRPATGRARAPVPQAQSNQDESGSARAERDQHCGCGDLLPGHAGQPRSRQAADQWNGNGHRAASRARAGDTEGGENRFLHTTISNQARVDSRTLTLEPQVT